MQTEQPDPQCSVLTNTVCKLRSLSCSSTFGLQVAAVDEPKLHLWETGVMRITRHPQSFGQALWCLAHTLWIGSSFMVATTGKYLIISSIYMPDTSFFGHAHFCLETPICPAVNGWSVSYDEKVTVIVWRFHRGKLDAAGALMAHHLFSCWHGDFRLRRKYGEVCFASWVMTCPLSSDASGMVYITVRR